MILDEIVADKKKRLVEHKQRISEAEMKKRCEELLTASNEKRDKCGKFYQALKKDGLSIIGEFKKASPSLGTIASQIDLKERIRQYSLSVDAISCLTEEDHFHGNVDYLREIHSLTELPIIRKDFIIDPYQVYEAKVIGASAILLIAAILSDEEMKALYELAHDCGLDVLLEVHDEEEMQRAVALGASIIGVNNRNLKDFTIDLHTTGRLSEYLDAHVEAEKRPVFVAESGVMGEEEISYLKECRVDALLIGRAFMEAKEPESLAKTWKKVYDGFMNS